MAEHQGVPPVVFNFRTESYRVLEAPEELAEWERRMKEDVGFEISASNVSRSCTESDSAGRKDDCDVD